MKAAILYNQQPIENNPLKIEEIEIPQINENEILIKVNACGICHTDLHIIEGELPPVKMPVIPGHQIVGIVEKIGGKVTKFKVGDKVGVPWLHSTCGKCEFCKRGKENLCNNAKFTGYHVNGGFAEYSKVSEDFAYRLPENLSNLNIAPLLCGGVIGYRALKLSEIKPGERLGLYGFGASAHIVIQIALYWNCEVYVFTRSEAHRTLASKLGAVWTGRAEDNPPKKMHTSIIFAPAGYLVREALRVLEKGGTIALAGIYMTPIPEIDYSLIYHERKITSVANSTREDVIELLKLAKEIPLKTEIQIFSLEEVNKALQLLKRSEIKGGAGVLKIH
ncbi:zinc-dependent alcohol dehydrogenase family protein [SCandidatus Aminicenantes bacterium Aminicenantia_JdfR_composite]|jgi:propanol-preferring alcohol dehydrogenase|nr:zinc-dependent alcohol dehydrogenase family protein [SCandidatus Aminicenantes bacterium Aminicenantia_JdfR_composite]MCP2596897.1 zinc-dependent alcohol dehydrogenase family protein [Candidatus Aminicenantes bacterium AC-335-G13]